MILRGLSSDNLAKSYTGRMLLGKNPVGNYLLLFNLLNSHAKFADRQSSDYKHSV